MTETATPHPVSATEDSAVVTIRPPEPATLEQIAREVRSLRARLEAHLDDERFERQRAQLRHDAIMELLKELFGRMPIK